MTNHVVDGEALLTPAEVAALFRVDPKTVTRWARAGKLASLRTLGGHRRYRESEVRGLLGGEEVLDGEQVSGERVSRGDGIVGPTDLAGGVDRGDGVDLASAANMVDRPGLLGERDIAS